jgi:hypothetical protein
VLLLSLDRPGDRLCLSDLILAPLKMNLLALFFYVTLLTSPSSTNILPSTVPVYLPRGSSLEEFNHCFASPAQFTQPLIVLSIPVPHVLVFGFVFDFLNDRNASDIYRPFMGYTLIWAGVFLSCAALAGLSRINTYVTRAVYETFGGLIAAFLFQQGIIGIVSEFSPDDQSTAGEHGITRPWRLINGLWSFILAILLTQGATLLTSAREWTFWSQSLRGFLSDYGAPLAAMVVTAISYAIPNTSFDVPRRAEVSQIYEQGTRNNLTVLTDMRIPGVLIAMAAIPGFITCVRSSILAYYFKKNPLSTSMLPIASSAIANAGSRLF